MNTNTQEEKEKLIGFEIMRLLQLSRDESVNDLLSAALAGREPTVESVSKLYAFILRWFGDPTGNTPSTVARKYWEACSAFLKDAGLTQQQLEQIHSPFRKPGEPGGKSILQEMEEEGLS
jgi:hypothetical protein